MQSSYLRSIESVSGSTRSDFAISRHLSARKRRFQYHKQTKISFIDRFFKKLNNCER